MLIDNVFIDRFLVIVTLFCLFFCVSCRRHILHFRGAEVNPVQLAPKITLTDHTGKEFNLEEQKGNVVIIFFGFTHCPDVCPLTMTRLKKVSEGLGSGVDTVRIVFITIDPKRDRKENLKNYLDIYDDDFIGLRGAPKDLEAVYSAYGIYHEIDTNGHANDRYLMNHTNSVFVIDKQGNWRLNFTDTASVDDIIHDVHILLNE